MATAIRAEAEEADCAFAKLRRSSDETSASRWEQVIEEINPILRGWVNYFRGRAFESLLLDYQNWVEKKIRRHLMRGQKRQGLAGNGGVGSGCTARWDCIKIIGWTAWHSRKRFQPKVS